MLLLTAQHRTMYPVCPSPPLRHCAAGLPSCVWWVSQPIILCFLSNGLWINQLSTHIPIMALELWLRDAKYKTPQCQQMSVWTQNLCCHSCHSAIISRNTGIQKHISKSIDGYKHIWLNPYVSNITAYREMNMLWYVINLKHFLICVLLTWVCKYRCDLASDSLI